MPDTGFVNAGTGTNYEFFAGLAWSNPGNITADDGVRAVFGNDPTGDASLYLRASNFGLSVPSGATIDGIEVRAQRHGTNPNVILDISVILFNASGDPTGDDHTPGTHWSSTPDTVETFGGAADLWGLTPSKADVEDVDWGWGMTGQQLSGFESGLCDVMQMKIYYTLAGGGPAQTLMGMAAL